MKIIKKCVPFFVPLLCQNRKKSMFFDKAQIAENDFVHFGPKKWQNGTQVAQKMAHTFRGFH